MLEVLNKEEEVQLVRALEQRKMFLDEIKPSTWDNQDNHGTLEEARAATSRMLTRANILIRKKKI
jgi:hypothetical protein